MLILCELERVKIVFQGKFMDAVVAEATAQVVVRRRVLAVALAVRFLRNRRRKTIIRRHYVHPTHVARSHSIFWTFLDYKRAAIDGDGRLFIQFIHMNCVVYSRLLDLVEPFLVKQRNHRYPLCAEERLVITLR